jgi:hypothetical protein
VCGSQNGTPSCNNGQCAIACNQGFADCNGNPADGCETNVTNDASHCGGCNTPCTLGAHAAGAACQGGMCVNTSCQQGWFDIDGNFGNGCECRGDGVGATCGAATGIPQLVIGGSIPETGNLVPAGKEDWYVVTFAGNHDAKNFHAQIALTTNPNNWFRFDVYADCAGNTLACQDGGISKALVQWENYWLDQNSGAYKAIDPFGNNNTVYIRVYRDNGPVTCDNYVLTVSD